MKLKHIISAGLTATILSTGAVYAQSAPQTNAEVVVMNSTIAALPKVTALVEALKAEGYTYIEIRRTFLGRAKIVASGPMGQREIVMSTATNELLRDSSWSNSTAHVGSETGMQPPVAPSIGSLTPTIPAVPTPTVPSVPTPTVPSVPTPTVPSVPMPHS